MAKINQLISQAKALLNPGEEVIKAIMESYETKLAGNDTVRKGVFLVTSERVFLYSKKMFGYETEVFPYSNISSVEVSKGFTGHKITIFASGNKACLKYISTGDVDGFVGYTRSRIGKKDAPTNSIPTVDIGSQIRQLAELREQGLLTEQEFQTKKAEMLARM